MKNKDLLKKIVTLVTAFLLLMTPSNVSVMADNKILETYQAQNGNTCYYCGEGTYWVNDCNHNMTTPVCKPCPSGTFNNRSGIPRYCSPCTKICNDKNSFIRENCTKKRDIICQCNNEFYKYYKISGDESMWYCKRHTVCSEGFGVEKAGTPEKDTVCEKCNEGITYSNSSSSTDICQNCTVCISGPIKGKMCNRFKDTICSEEEVSRRSLSSENNRHLVYILIPIGLVIIAAIVLILYAKRKGKWCFKARASDDSKEAGLETDGHFSDIINPPTDHTAGRQESPTWDRFFMELSGKIIKNWQCVVKELFGQGGSDIIAEAETDFRNVRDRIFFCLEKWKRKTCPKSIDPVIKAVKKHCSIKQRDLSELQQKYSSLCQQ